MASLVSRRVLWTAAALWVLGAAGYLAQDRLAGMLPVPAREDAAVVARPAQPVRVTRVTLAAQERTTTYTGTIRPQDEAPLGFRLPGKLTARLVTVGDRVTTGQVLAQLDDTDARLELAVAKAERDAAATDLDRATADLIRSRTLFANGHIAQAALDRAISGVAEAQSRADRAATAVALSANRLAYTTLRADSAGIVTATLAETGQVVAAGQPVLSLAETTRLDVVFSLPEQRRDRLDQVTATAVLWGQEDRPYDLTLRDVSPDVDPVGRTYRVRMTLVDADAAAALGRTATVRLTEAPAAAVIPLPMAAVLNDGSGSTVWRLAAGADHVDGVAVELVAMDGAVATVRGPLAEGDLVVSLGAHKLDPSRPVRVVETTDAPES
jgi:RND family efflux transporter MFP subunit